jgi:hypothetical protein
MAKHTKRRIRDACIAVLESKTAEPPEVIKAATLLYKMELSRVKGKPRGKPFSKKNSGRSAIDRISELTGALQ